MPRPDYEYPGYDRSGPLFWLRTVAVYGAVAIGALWMLVPIWVAFATSVSSTAATGVGALTISEFTLANYADVWTTVPMDRWFLNSLVFAGAVTLFNVSFDSLAGYALAKLDFWGRDVLFLVFISTLMIPFVVLIVPLYLSMVNLDWTNTYRGLIIPFIANPLGIFLYRQYFRDLPDSLGDAARMDGCNELQVFYHVYLPVAKPATVALGIFTFVTAWKNFEWPLIIATDEAMYTLPLAIFQVQNQYYTDWRPAMAAAMIIVVPLLIVFLALQRHIMRGFSFGGLKG